MTCFVNLSERKKIPPMITDSNQGHVAKMAGRRGRRIATDASRPRKSS